MSLSASVKVPQEVLARHVGEETVILHLVNGTYYCLDAVGARVWQLLEQGRTLGDVCHVLTDEYDVPRDQLEQDVLDLVESLSGHGLVVVV